MKFVSYAQNFEDVMLARALGDVESGFYIDIGAQDPVIDSVSLAFYQRGWRGINIEPTRQYFDKLARARPEDCVEQLAVGDQEGCLAFYEFPDTGLSTADPGIAKRHQAAGFRVVQTEVPVVRLETLLNRCTNRDVHWLKIDVEGMEKSVLDSWGTSAVRPWILLIESTKPLTQEASYEDWETAVLEKGYVFAYFDGLNRFYVHEDHNKLHEAFHTPPNIFDEFALSGLASQPFCQLVIAETREAQDNARQTEARMQQALTDLEQALTDLDLAGATIQRTREDLNQAEYRIRESEARTTQAEIRAAQSESRTQEIEKNLNAVLRSRSWRLTQPLRSATLHLSVARNALIIGPAVRRISARILRWVVSLLSRYPKVKDGVIFWMHRFPAVGRRLRSMLMRADALVRDQERIRPIASKAHRLLDQNSILSRSLDISGPDESEIIASLTLALKGSSEAKHLSKRPRSN